jgi:hypothetical protein
MRRIPEAIHHQAPGGRAARREEIDEPLEPRDFLAGLLFMALARPRS